METKLTKIFLHGKLGKTYGKEWVLDVKSPAEAIHAIDVNVGGALKRQLISEGNSKYYKICLGNKNNSLDKKEIANPSGNTDIHIIPAIKGKNSGLGKVLTAIAIIIAVVVLQQYELLPALPGLTVAQTAMTAYMMAGSLLIGGISQMLAPTQNINYGSSDDDGRGSGVFQGNTSIVSQGSAVGLVYGRMLVTPMPVALVVNNYDQSPPAGYAQNPGCYKVTTENGLIVYEELENCPDPIL